MRSAEEMLAEALEANRHLSELASALIEDNAVLRADLEKARTDLAVLQRLLFGAVVGEEPPALGPEPPAAAVTASPLRSIQPAAIGGIPPRSGIKHYAPGDQTQ